MPELPHLSGAEVVRVLERLGFIAVRQRGSHVMMRRGAAGCVVPLHREVKRGTLGGILRQADVDATEFIEALGRCLDSEGNGGVPPCGHRTHQRIVIDPDVLQHDEVWSPTSSAAEKSSGSRCFGRWKNDGMPARQLVERFYDQLWNQVDLAIASEILHPDVSFRGSVGLAALGRTEVCNYVTMVTTALDQYRCDVEMLVAEGAAASARVRFSGLHSGDFLGHPPSGRRIEWMGAAFFVAEQNMLREIWVLGDLAGLRAQLDQAS